MIGRKLVLQLLEKGAVADGNGGEQMIEEIVVCDVTAPEPAFPEDSRLRVVVGEFGEPEILADLVTFETDLIFHLAAVVSGGAEADFDLGMKVNLHDNERLLEAVRATERVPRFVFASSVAVYGGEMPEVIEDGTALNPQTSYGGQKAMMEFLVNDYTRKGFLDGRALRLPTISVRPGKPNKAASSFASSIIREPLQGKEYLCPVPPEAEAFLMSPRRVVECFVQVAELAPSALGVQRALQLPGLTVSLAQTMDALQIVGGEQVASRVGWEPDPVVTKIVAGWPVRIEAKRAEALGFHADESLEEIIRIFIEDDLGGKFVA